MGVHLKNKYFERNIKENKNHENYSVKQCRSKKSLHFLFSFCNKTYTDNLFFLHTNKICILLKKKKLYITFLYLSSLL